MTGSLQFETWHVGTCQCYCRLCDTTFGNTIIFWHHVTNFHNISIKDFREIHPDYMVSRVSIVCQICNRKMLHDLGKMTKHMRECHDGLPLDKYFEEYINEAPEKSATENVKVKPPTLCPSTKDQLTSNDQSSNSSNSDVHAGGNDVLMMSQDKGLVSTIINEASSTSNCKVENSGARRRRLLEARSIFKKKCLQAISLEFRSKSKQTQKRKPVSESTKAPRRNQLRHVNDQLQDESEAKGFSAWVDQCVFSCSCCHKKSNSRNIIHNHIVKSHAKRAKVLMTKITKLPCKLCGGKLVWQYSNLYTHSKGVHKCTLKEYYEKCVAK